MIARMSRLTSHASLFAAACLLAALALAPSAPAQDAPGPLTKSFLGMIDNARQNLEQSAELMPAESYEFRPTPEVRPFGEWIAHTAMSNYGFCSRIKGEPRPDVAHLEKLKAKPEIAKALRDSFEYCKASFDGLDDQKAMAEVTVGKSKYARVDPMLGLVRSLHSHYGTLAVYLRLKNIVPPSTARARQQQAR